MRKFLKKTIDVLFDKALIISGICVIILSVIDISNLDEWDISILGIEKFEIGKLFYYLTVFFSLIFGALAVIHGQEIEALEKDNNEKSIKINDLESKLNEVVNETNELFNSYLRLLLKNLSFTHTERISVYKVYENKFKLIGRASVDPTLSSTGRTEYPIRDGFIGKGWREGEFFVKNLPELTLSNGNTYYNAINKINPIPRDVVNSLKMKSRNFFVYRINGYDGNPKAVLVFESLQPSSFEKDFIVEKLNGVKQPLIMFIEKNNGIALTENILGV